MSTRGEQVRAAILQTGLALWRVDASKVTARGIGEVLGLTHAGVLHHSGTSAKLRDAVAQYAVKMRDPIVVPQLIVARHPAAASLSDAERRELLSHV